MDEERKRIGHRIYELRKKAGLSQAELAEKIGINSNNISRIEHGRYNVGFDMLQKIAEAFNSRIDFTDK